MNLNTSSYYINKKEENGNEIVISFKGRSKVKVNDGSIQQSMMDYIHNLNTGMSAIHLLDFCIKELKVFDTGRLVIIWNRDTDGVRESIISENLQLKSYKCQDGIFEKKEITTITEIEYKADKNLSLSISNEAGDLFSSLDAKGSENIGMYIGGFLYRLDQIFSLLQNALLEKEKEKQYVKQRGNSVYE